MMTTTQGPSSKRSTWTQLTQDPTPTEYREHIADAWWISADGSEMIERQHTVENPKPCYYRFALNAPADGQSYPTLTTAKRG